MRDILIKENFTLANGDLIPKMGFGCYTPCKDAAKNQQMFETAIEAGFTYFDTASLYETERPLAAAIAATGIARSELQIASKAWVDEIGYQDTKDAFYRSLDRLKVDYLDMYLLHWPRQATNDTGWIERDRGAWKALEELKKEGLVKNIGLSNYLPHHLKPLLETCEIRPVVDQLELHPGYSQELAVAFCQKEGILPQAWSPLARGKVIGHPAVEYVAAKYGRTAAEVSLCFLIQKGIMPLPKATTTEKMKANAAALDFTMSEEDISILSCMQQDTWSGEHPDFVIPTKKSNRDQ